MLAAHGNRFIAARQPAQPARPPSFFQQQQQRPRRQCGWHAAEAQPASQAVLKLSRLAEPLLPAQCSLLAASSQLAGPAAHLAASWHLLLPTMLAAAWLVKTSWKEVVRIAENELENLCHAQEVCRVLLPCTGWLRIHAGR